MPSYEEVQKMLAEAQTPKEKADAARALAEHIPQEHANKQLVTMNMGGGNVVKLGDLPNAMQNPRIYDRVKKAIGGKK